MCYIKDSGQGFKIWNKLATKTAAVCINSMFLFDKIPILGKL